MSAEGESIIEARAMTLANFIDRVRLMREAQLVYVKARSAPNRKRALEREAAVDAYFAKVPKSQPELL